MALNLICFFDINLKREITVTQQLSNTIVYF